MEVQGTMARLGEDVSLLGLQLRRCCGHAAAVKVARQRLCWLAVVSACYWALCAHSELGVGRHSFVQPPARQRRLPPPWRRLSMRSSADDEIVFNYFSQEYAMKPKLEAPNLLAGFSELLPWSAAEQEALEMRNKESPKWRESPFGSNDEAGVRRCFRAVVGAVGSEEDALQALRRNPAIFLFGEGQIRKAGVELVQALGQAKATEVILKNPGVLTIDPSGLKDSMGSIVLVADIIDVIVRNSAAAKFVATGVQGAFAVAIGKALFDVVQLRLLTPTP
mmetsp:Transcript_116898/g.372219  ORF Transcript_116898/g.372219 Transcript_116898/m.372219 type:complete len:278 (-) Transcript_116898:37-870(-)